MIGQVVGSYRIVAELGKGGMGMVYRAEHVQLGRPAALKVLLPQLSRDPEIVQRFFNEARAASRIDHPGIVEVYDFGTHADGSAYLVMALLRGESLEQRLRRAPMTPGEGATIVAQVASALGAAHAQGIVHRDLKPDNIFLVPNDLMPGGVQVKLLDFGIAKLADEQAAGLRTQTGALIGTPAYMSPEQCMGRSDLDHRTDLYSLGCILFHILCGRPPFVSEHGTGVMIAAHIRDPAPHPRSLNPQVPEALAAITMRLLEKEPAARFQSAAELRAALASAGADVPATSRVAAPPAGEAYAATLASSPGTAPTTRSSAVGQVATVPTPPARGRATWLAVGAVVLVAAAGVFAFVGTRGDGEPPAERPAIPAPAPVEVEAPPAPVAPVPVAPVPMPEPPPPRPVEPAPPPPPPERPRASSKVTFRLASRTYAPGEPIAITFSRAVPSVDPNRAWVTVVAADAAPSSYAEWVFVDDGARKASLKAPTAAGVYEVRLHTDYPARPHHLQHAVRITVGEAEAPEATPPSKQRFTLASTTLRGGASAELRFPGPMHARPGEQFWVTIVARGAADNTWGAYDYVPDGARSMQLPVPTAPGDYEIRLHANYPTKTTNVVHRLHLVVE